jgi:galactosamine-6-phosphate isomerase
MEWLEFPSQAAFDEAACDYLAASLREKPRVHWCLVTKLDEWLGLPIDHPSTCESYLVEHVLGPLGIGKDRYVGADSEAKNPMTECERVAAASGAWGAFDVALLGVGRNGHFGMIEPAPSLEPGIHVATLDDKTRGHSMLQGVEQPPTQGITFGLREVLASKLLLILLSGAEKDVPREALKAGKVTTQIPATFALLHPNSVLLSLEMSR